eukprot:992767-Lingulodinium_polyedra.AAC.1
MASTPGDRSLAAGELPEDWRAHLLDHIASEVSARDRRNLERPQSVRFVGKHHPATLLVGPRALSVVRSDWPGPGVT